MYRLVGTACLAAAALLGQGMPADSADFFESRVRSVLAHNCFGCHTNTAMGDLRLDSRDAMIKGGKRGPAVVPGAPEKSLLITAVQHKDPAYKMPMGGKLKDREIEDLTAWVKAGAVWPATATVATAKASGGQFVILPEMRKFWSLQPLQSPAPPVVKDARWPKTDIDRFILARLEHEGLKPVRFASKRDLIRRAYLNLTGLPPTYDEIQTFEKDASPDAFAKVVDKLLSSPQYGERWGRYWLDVARYGEDDYRSLNPFPRGYRPYPNAFAYRDWVIAALNDDIPYDMFVKAQLAGDLLDRKQRHRYLPATGFLGLGPWYYDNGAFEITRADERHDRIDVVSRGFLGLTVGCARCHDHKYDPIPQTDYYALAGVFYNTIYEEYPLAPKKAVEEHQKLEADFERAEKMFEDAAQNVSTELSRSLAYQAGSYLMAVWEVGGPRKKPVEQVVEARRLDFELLDRWIKYMAKPTRKYAYKNAWQAMMAKPDSTQAEAKKLAEEFQQEIVEAMLDQDEVEAENRIIAAKDLDGTKPKKRTDKPSNFMSFKDFNPGSWLQLKSLPEDRNNLWTEIFQRELGESDDPNAMMMMGRRNMKPGVLLFRGWGLESRVGSEAQGRLKSLKAGVDAIRKKLDARYPFLHGVRDAEKPVDIQLSHRGDPANPVGAPIPRHFLSVLSPDRPAPFAQGSGRLELADAVVSHPLAMRVIVNRVWKWHFGSGIVDTPSNFGMTGERPTNPDLLEHLATSFRRNGMSFKKLHREIMLSSVYQLATDDDALAFRKDSGNRLYWRANRKRMEAEQLRDSIMHVSGNLDLALGGPSEDLSPKMLRRTVYGKVSRYKTDEYLTLFDFPSPLISAEKRFTTTVPSQRLFLMNSDFMQLQAEEIASKVAGETNNRERIRKAHRLVYGRDATEQEIALGLEYLKTEPMAQYEERKKKPAGEAAKGDHGGLEPVIGGDPKSAPGETEPMPPSVMDMSEGPQEESVFAMGMGMMGGLGDLFGFVPDPYMRRKPAAPAPPSRYEASIWGRYAKVLLSSSEFLFIN